MIFSIPNDEITQLNGTISADFPKYTSQLINLANQNAHGTRPKVVGQLSSELFPEYQGANESISPESWRTWYFEHYPDAIDIATEKIYGQVENLKQAITLIDKELIRAWVEDLVINKTYNGLYVQEAILKKLAEMNHSTYRLATPDEESKGIDGYVGEKAYSVKPDTYKTMGRLSESIDITMIYYSKKKSGLSIEVAE